MFAKNYSAQLFIGYTLDNKTNVEWSSFVLKQ